MTDFRALCAELLDWAEVTAAHYIQLPAVMLRARAALADEPAVPEGREPVAVTGQPSDQEGPSAKDVEELCEEHCFNVEGYESIECLQGLINEAIARWGNRQGSLDSSAPQLADWEVAECAAELEEQKPRPDYDRVQKIATEAQIRSAAQYLAKKQHCDGDLIPAIRYAIARWGNPSPQPPAEGEVAELALKELERTVVLLMPVTGHKKIKRFDTIRAALKRLQELENNADLSPAPAPADGEVVELVQHLHHAAEVDDWDGASPEWCQSMLRAAELLQRLSPPQPVPVSERLPGPEAG